MTREEIVARLRAHADSIVVEHPEWTTFEDGYEAGMELATEAADRLEALERENAELREALLSFVKTGYADDQVRRRASRLLNKETPDGE